jgi:hypothetical protein
MGSTWSTQKAQLEEATTEDESSGIDELPVVEQLRLLRQAGISTSGSGIEISGPLAFLSLSSLVVVVLAALYRLYRYKMNKGYMVIVEKD